MRSPSAGRTIVRRWCLRRLQLLPMFLLVGGALFDYHAGADVSGVAFYAAAPMTAAALLSLRATVLAGLGSCAADFVLLSHFGFMRGSVGQGELAVVATVSAFAIVVNRLVYWRAAAAIRFDWASADRRAPRGGCERSADWW